MDGTSKISGGGAFMMFFVAMCIDGLQGFLTFIYIGVVVNPLISFVAWLLFIIWFYHLGVKRLGSVSGAGFAEFIPLLGSLPIWTGYITYVIASTKLRELGWVGRA